MWHADAGSLPPRGRKAHFESAVDRIGVDDDARRNHATWVDETHSSRRLLCRSAISA